ncbi:MAG: response regulator transcription factor [Chloroflexi bacterium]|nr:response regulator transcription factor [Chloroflexota bacterium]
MIRALLADDHQLVREGLKSILEQATDISVIAEASNGLEAIQEYQRTHPDVAILDISMPGMDGLDAVKQISSFDPDARVLILTVYPEQQYAVRALKAGALGYITKGTSSRELHNAVRLVFQGKQFLSNEARDNVMLQLLAKQAQVDPVDSLSDRELQVLCLIARGQKPKEIADDLRLSAKTIESYKSRAMRKLDLRNDAEICRFVFDNKLIEGITPPGDEI